MVSGKFIVISSATGALWTCALDDAKLRIPKVHIKQPCSLLSLILPLNIAIVHLGF